MVRFLTGCFSLILLSSLGAQRPYTIPEHVWRIRTESSFSIGNWMGRLGTDGIRNEPFELDGYGKRYFDHELLDNTGYPSSTTDFYDIDEMFITATQTVNNVITDFNTNHAPMFGGDTLPDYSQEFFGSNPVLIGGTLDLTRDRIRTEQSLTIDYGLSDNLMAHVQIPFIFYHRETVNWTWSGNPIPGMASFTAYHQAARAAFDSLFAEPFYGTLDAQTQANLEAIYSRLYSWEGQTSVLWALGGGTDPVRQGIYGTEYNPFATDDTTSTTIDSVMAFYYPPNRTASGVGDITLSLVYRFFGDPTWKQKRGTALYVGLSARLPMAPALRKYSSSTLISSRPNAQFQQLPLGSGIPEWTLSLGGEHRREYVNRPGYLRWKTHVNISPPTPIAIPISFRGMGQFHPDSIVAQTGKSAIVHRGIRLAGEATWTVQPIPKVLTLLGGVRGVFQLRNTYYSDSNRWNDWAQTHEDNSGFRAYDTRSFDLVANVGFTLHRSYPGHISSWVPFPYDIDVLGSIPLIQTFTYRDFRIGLGFVGYFQGW